MRGARVCGRNARARRRRPRLFPVRPTAARLHPCHFHCNPLHAFAVSATLADFDFGDREIRAMPAASLHEPDTTGSNNEIASQKAAKRAASCRLGSCLAIATTIAVATRRVDVCSLPVPPRRVCDREMYFIVMCACSTRMYGSSECFYVRSALVCSRSSDTDL